VNAREKFVHGKSCEAHVDADHCRAVHRNATDVTFTTALAILFWIQSIQVLGFEIGLREDSAVEEVGAIGPQIMDCARNLIDCPVLKCFEFDSYVYIRKGIVASKSRKKIAARK
jgi:hypothetical protein